MEVVFVLSDILLSDLDPEELEEEDDEELPDIISGDDPSEGEPVADDARL